MWPSPRSGPARRTAFPPPTSTGSFTIRGKLLSQGISTVGDLLKDRKNGVLSHEELAAKIGLRTIRIPFRIPKEVKNALHPDRSAYLENP